MKLIQLLLHKNKLKGRVNNASAEFFSGFVTVAYSLILVGI